MESPSPLAGVSKVTKKERIAQLEAEVAALKAQVAALYNGYQPYWYTAAGTKPIYVYPNTTTVWGAGSIPLGGRTD